MDDSFDTEGLSFDEKIALLEEELPVAIQNFLHSSERDSISLKLSQKYNLHADQAGAFERAYLYMLLGVNSPEDFVRDLQEAGIPSETIKGLTADINELVFKKLQQQELAATPQQRLYRTPQTQPVVPAPQITAPVSPTPEPAPEAPSFNLARPGALVAQPAAIRTMQKDMALISSPKQSMSLDTLSHPEHSTPARSFQTASIPREIAPPPHTPIQQAPQITPSKPVQDANAAPIAHEYGSDPYREPIN